MRLCEGYSHSLDFVCYWFMKEEKVWNPKMFAAEESKLNDRHKIVNIIGEAADLSDN
jgi:hypothetical protein